MEDSGDFQPSKLGTREYWDSVYDREVANFEDNGDIGEVWFGMDSVESVVDWIVDHGISRNVSVVDIGCGNGATLLELAKVGFTSLLGIDYSAPAIDLARKVAEHEGHQIDYEVFDILKDEPSRLNSQDRFPFELCVDKGTYDAISLSDLGPKAREAYVSQVHALCAQSLRHHKTDDGADDEDGSGGEEAPEKDADARGYFVITSCNWTNDELKAFFASHFDFFSAIKYRVFEFGGKKGQSISTVIFRPKAVPQSV